MAADVKDKRVDERPDDSMEFEDKDAASSDKEVKEKEEEFS